MYYKILIQKVDPKIIIIKKIRFLISEYKICDQRSGI